MIDYDEPEKVGIGVIRHIHNLEEHIKSKEQDIVNLSKNYFMALKENDELKNRINIIYSDLGKNMLNRFIRNISI